MKTADYLDRLLLRYAGTFDIYQPYMIRGREYPAYGYFFSHVEKYVLVREANMWTSDSYEHIVFMQEEAVTPDILQEAESVIRDYMEPVLVRKGEKYPEKNHMYSYLTVVVLTERAVEPQLARQIKKFSFDKGYRFNLRGFCQGRLAAVSMEEEKVYTNAAARQSRRLYQEIFQEVKDGRQGFLEHIRQNGIELKKQEDAS